MRNIFKNITMISFHHLHLVITLSTHLPQIHKKYKKDSNFLNGNSKGYLKTESENQKNTYIYVKFESTPQKRDLYFWFLWEKKLEYCSNNKNKRDSTACELEESKKQKLVRIFKGESEKKMIFFTEKSENRWIWKLVGRWWHLSCRFNFYFFYIYIIIYYVINKKNIPIYTISKRLLWFIIFVIDTK